MDSFKLPLSFDVPRLIADLDHVERDAKWHNHPDYTVANSGDWTAVALIAPETTDPDDQRSLRYFGGKGHPTALLSSCAYLPEVVASFKTEVHRARLMNLRPGTNIAPHRDYGRQRYSLERGFIRVHVPLRTHEKVYFFINGNVIPMRAGEAWYTNVCEPHAVRNDSDVHRVHLVLDMKVNDWVRSLLPAQSLGSQAYGFVLRHWERPTLTARFAMRDFYLQARSKAGDLGLRRLRGMLRG